MDPVSVTGLLVGVISTVTQATASIRKVDKHRKLSSSPTGAVLRRIESSMGMLQSFYHGSSPLRERLDDEIGNFIIKEFQNITGIIPIITQFQQKLEDDKFWVITSESKDVAALREIAHTLEILEQRLHNLDQK